MIIIALLLLSSLLLFYYYYYYYYLLVLMYNYIYVCFIYNYSYYPIGSITIHELANPFNQPFYKGTKPMIPDISDPETSKQGADSRGVLSWWTSWDVSLGLTRICSMLMRKAWWECFAMNMPGTSEWLTFVKECGIPRTGTYRSQNILISLHYYV